MNRCLIVLAIYSRHSKLFRDVVIGTSATEKEAPIIVMDPRFGECRLSIAGVSTVG